MTIKELKAILEAHNDDDMVVMAKDGEGNGYSPLSNVELMRYRPERRWSGEVGLREIQAGYTEEDVFDEDGDVDCIVLWPIN